MKLSNADAVFELIYSLTGLTRRFNYLFLPEKFRAETFTASQRAEKVRIAQIYAILPDFWPSFSLSCSSNQASKVS